MLQPNATLYVKNIDWKIKKGLLRRALYSLFSRYGKVLEIITLRKDGLRGQAFVIMDDVLAATSALQALQGFTFFGKDLVIEYARAKSDRISKRDGDYVPKSKRQKITTKEEIIKQETVPENKTIENEQMEGNVSAGESMEQPPSIPPPVADDTNPPSKLLLAQNLPDECNDQVLGMLFQQYPGYRETRLPRPGLAFIEFEDEPNATVAMNALQGFGLTQQDKLQLSYGKL
jgi:RNA recognition motif-containing protein